MQTWALLVLYCLLILSVIHPSTSHNRRIHRTRHHQNVVLPHGGKTTENVECPPSTKCQIITHNLQDIQEHFYDTVNDHDSMVIQFNIQFVDTDISVMEDYPYMGSNFRASEWYWASGKLGRRILGLPLDADVLSLYILGTSRNTINLFLSGNPPRCVVMLSSECRLQAVRRMFIDNITHISHNTNERSYICNRYLSHNVDITTNHSSLMMNYRCCDSDQYDDTKQCEIYTTPINEIFGVSLFINIIAAIVTLYSPIIIMQLKLILQFNTVTKFFRASLKHGITGQRNYVIRISSRQLINLNDPKPFSIPRFLFRLLFHCYGEGRCCIHWWGDWDAQPNICHKQSWCQKIYFNFWRFAGVAIFYPGVFYIALALYLPRLSLYNSVLKYAETYKDSHIKLDINVVALVLMPFYNPGITIWVLFSFVAFIYTVLLLSWPNNPLEKCLLNYEGKRPFDQPHVLYTKMTRGYKDILHKLAYGEYRTKRHFFRVKWIPWGIRRAGYFIGRVLTQIPIVNVAFTMLMFDSRMFKLRESDSIRDFDEAEDEYSSSRFSCMRCCKWMFTIIIWIGFLAILSGYCTSVFLMVQFILHVLFYTCLASVLDPSTVLPWVSLILILCFYTNDTLTTINNEHKEILRLIDENSPRISAVEDAENLLKEGAVQILKSHNLGAVKFIDGDNTEYVSKELYYNVCTDLKCGWSRSVRRIIIKISSLSFYVIFIFLICYTMAILIGSTIFVIFIATLFSLIPKLIEAYVSFKSPKTPKKVMWAKIIPDILDRHIRVDRHKCLDDAEIELSTYDVRPVGLLEMDIPRLVHYGNLHMWKFPWIVSADQQTQSSESFIVALSNKLAAASFLGKIVTRAYSINLEEEIVLRQWSLLIENCILEGSSTAGNINGVPLESIRIFPREVQPLVSNFRTGNTVDSIVDNINRELYGPYTKGVLVTIGNTPIAIGKLDSTMFAFNASCHGEQVTDLFGAVLIMTDFNTQNLQSVIKFLMDPYSPDSVPVYTMVPTEGFIFRSPEILEIESPISSESLV